MKRLTNFISGNKIPLDPYYKHIVAIFLGIAIADVTVLNIRDLMLPKKSPPKKINQRTHHTRTQRSQYESIIERNLLSSKDFMPKILTADAEELNPAFSPETKPVLSGLPLKLVGTIVHANPERSVASIELKSRNKILPFSKGDTIDNIARVQKITRRQLIFQNLNNNRLEYVEMKIDAKVSYEIATKQNTKGQQVADGILKEGNKFSIKRSTLEEHLKNLPKLLQEARAVPNRDPLTGEINGFRILDLLPGSILEKLGIARLDIIKGVNGESIHSPEKAMGAFNRLKGASNIKISIARDGKEEELDYTIE